MAKVLEYHYGNNWWDKLQNFLAVDTDSIKSFAIAIDNRGVWFPGFVSNFYGGFLFLRFTWPVGFFVHIKPIPTGRFQIGFGWKINGRFAFTFRWQSDKNAAKGVHGPNFGQAKGWDRGTA